MDLTRLPEVDVQVTAPLSLSASRAVWVDTLDLVPPEWLDYHGVLNLEAESTLPVGAILRLELVDLPESLTLFGSVFGTHWWVMDELSCGLDQVIPTPVAVTTSGFHAAALRGPAPRRGSGWKWNWRPGRGNRVSADQRVVLRGLLNGDAQISIE